MKGRTTHVVMKALVYAEIQVVISLMKSRMRESRTSGSVRGGGSNPPVYSTHYRPHYKNINNTLYENIGNSVDNSSLSLRHISIM